MPDQRDLYRPDRVLSERCAARTREVVQRSFKILNESPKPDTFLGRRTKEPFPDEEKEK